MRWTASAWKRPQECTCLSDLSQPLGGLSPGKMVRTQHCSQEDGRQTLFPSDCIELRFQHAASVNAPEGARSFPVSMCVVYTVCLTWALPRFTYPLLETNVWFSPDLHDTGQEDSRVEDLYPKGLTLLLRRSCSEKAAIGSCISAEK